MLAGKMSLVRDLQVYRKRARRANAPRGAEAGSCRAHVGLAHIIVDQATRRVRLRRRALGRLERRTALRLAAFEERGRVPDGK